MKLTRSLAAIAACASLVLIPAAAEATHGSGSSSRAQKYIFAYGGNLPPTYQTPVNQGFAAWDVGGQCHDWRMSGSPIHTTVYYQGYDGYGNVGGFASSDHTTIILDSAEDWWAAAGSTPANRLDVRGMTTHESGHMLSLIHTANGADVMHPVVAYGTNSENDRYLSGNDVSRIQTLYPGGTCIM